MAVSTIGKEFITRNFSGTFPAFSAGSVGSRIDYVMFNVAVDGYTPISASLSPLYPGATFGCFVSLNDTQVIVTQNRMSGYAEPNPYNFVVKVLYKKV